jgi:hypothetical protein
LEAKPRKTTCPECSAEFEVDDRLECIFINPNKLRLPMVVNGTVCGVCGPVQGDEVERCGYYWIELGTTMHEYSSIWRTKMSELFLYTVATTNGNALKLFKVKERGGNHYGKS